MQTIRRLGPTVAILSDRLPLSPNTILSHCRSNQIFQGWLVDLVSFMEVYRPGFLSLKPGIEELVAIRKTRALEKVHFHISLESTYS